MDRVIAGKSGACPDSLSGREEQCEGLTLYAQGKAAGAGEKTEAGD